MKSEHRFINQLMPGETLDQVFLVRDKDLRTTKNGDLFLLCTLVDRTGHLRVTESIYNSIPVNGFLHVKGRTEEYRGNLQFIIDACRPYPKDKANLSDFIPVTELDIEATWSNMLETLREVKDPSLRMLIK